MLTLGPKWLPNALLGLLAAAISFEWIVESRIGILQAILTSLSAFVLIGSVLCLGGRSRSSVWKAVAGIAVALIFVYACYMITGHWPHKRWSPE